MSLSDTVEALLAQHKVPHLRSELMQARGERAELERQLGEIEHTIGWWDRLSFFTDTPEEARAQALRDALDAAREREKTGAAALNTALDACTQACPPLAIVHGVDKAIAAFRGDASIGCDEGTSARFGETLDALTERVREIWLGDADVAKLVDSLSDAAARRAAAAQAAPDPAVHDDLGWAPITEQEVFARLAHAFEHSEDAERARNLLERERADVAATEAAEQAAKAEVTTLDKMNPFDSPREKKVSLLERDRARAERELAFAGDVVRFAIARSFARHPATWLFMTLRGAAAAARAARPGREASLVIGGDVASMSSRYARAILAACLVETRRACAGAFPGLVELASESAHPRSPLRGNVGPYRERREDTAPAPPESPDTEARFAADLEGGGLRGHLVHAVATASVLGLIELSREAASERVRFADRVAFWSDSEDEATKRKLEGRALENGAQLDAYGRSGRHLVERFAAGHPRLGLGQALTALGAAAQSLRTEPGSSSGPMSCPAHGKAEALAAVAHAEERLHRHYGTTSDRNEWVRHIVALLQRPPQLDPESAAPPARYEEAIVLAAERLRSTPFLGLLSKIQELRGQRAEAGHKGEQAADAVSFWDKVNVFSDSEAEKQRDAWKERGAELDGARAELTNRATALLENAVSIFPPMILHERLNMTKAALNRVHAQSERRTRTHTTRDSKGNVISTRTETYYVCVLYGADAARAAATDVCARTLATFGALPNAGALVEWWVLREL